MRSRHVSGWEASQVLKTRLERPGTMSRSREGPLRSWTGAKSKMTVTCLSPYGVWRHTCSSTPMTRTPSHRAGSLISRRAPSARTAVFAALPGHAQGLGDARQCHMTNNHARQRPAHRRTRELGTRIGRLTHVLTPHVSTRLAPVAAHAHMQDRGTPPTGLMRQAPDHRATRNALAPTASTPPVLTSNTARQQIMVWLNVLTRHLQPQAIQASERAQIRTIKDSIGHVEVSQMDGVAISIIGRPRPLPGHDTPNAAHNTYTLKCDDPVKAAQGYEFLGGMRRMTTIQALRTLSSILWLRRYDLSSSKLPGPVRGNSEASWIDKWIG